ncbi:hypothetical protein FRC02_005927 [Tulasnella sp. 418]|nr:hypothetical protein FRC02_005927 [Tulasnella sp. 418]
MAKKSLNPADAHRKAQRKKELQKNKDNRAKAREVSTLKKDTGGYEAEIRELEEASKKGDLDSNQRSRLDYLRSEVSRIKKTKSDYVAAHPEHKHLVYRGSEKKGESSEASQQKDGKQRSLFGKDGLPRHPERSIYYDPVLNPYGFPPPGMPYVERPLLSHEIEDQPEAGQEKANQSDQESGDDDDEDDEDIPLPPGPPPDKEDSDDDSDNDSDDSDIPLPEGPPPKLNFVPPLPPGPPPPLITPGFPPQVYPNGMPVTIPPFVPQVPGPIHPPPPPGFPPASTFMPAQPPAGFPTATIATSMTGFTVPPPPLRPNLPRAPISSASSLPTPPSNMTHPLPAPPKVAGSSSTTSATEAVTTISAEPQLRDFKKESMAFVPSAVKRKQHQLASTVKKSKVDSAPDNDGGINNPKKPDLMGAIKSGLGDKLAPPVAQQKKVDDYDAFMAEMEGLL